PCFVSGRRRGGQGIPRFSGFYAAGRRALRGGMAAARNRSARDRQGRADGKRDDDHRNPIRVDLIAAGFVDTPLSESLLGDQLDERGSQLRATLPIGRVVGPADVAALAAHVMTNTALTGATYDVDGGQQLVSG